MRVSRFPFRGVSIGASLPRLVHGHNTRPATESEAITGLRLLLRAVEGMFSFDVHPWEWHPTRVDVAMDFLAPAGPNTIYELARYVVPDRKKRLFLYGDAVPSLYLQQTLDSRRYSERTIVYLKAPERLRLETRFSSRSLRRSQCRPVLEEFLHLGDVLAAEAWRRARRRWEILLWERSLSAPTPYTAKREAMDEHLAALEEMSYSDLVRLSPWPSKEVRQHVRLLVERGELRVHLNDECSRVFAGVLGMKEFVGWSPD